MNLPEWTALGLGLGTGFTAFLQVYQTYKDKIAARKTEERGRLLVSIEKQGNGMALELKRKNMMLALNLADVTQKEGDRAIANEACVTYQHALVQYNTEQNQK